MTARLIRRYRVWQAYSRLVAERLDLGYGITAYNDALARAEAERSVP